MARRSFGHAVADLRLIDSDLLSEGEGDGMAWGYVRLACGEAAQRGAFGVAARPPDLLTALEPLAEARREACQGEFPFDP